MSAGARVGPGLYRGWWIVAAGFVCTLLAIGGTTYSFGLFVTPLSEEFGLSRADANGGFIFLLVGFAVWAPIVGRLLDRLPARSVMIGGAVLFAIGFTLIALAQSPLIMGLAVLGPVSLGTVACGALASNTLTARWFRAHRGRAMGVLAIATSAGGFVVPPLTALLMAQLGWRGALGALGLIVLVVVTLCVGLLVRDRPSDLGLEPDGAAAAASPAQAPPPERSWSTGALLRNANFWLIAWGTGILLAADQALLASMIPYGVDAGFGAQRAALLVSCLTFSAIFGKLAIGMLADRIDKRWLFTAVAACNLAFLLVLLSAPGFVPLMVACCVIGLAIGGTYPLWMTLTADCFGSTSFGAVMGTMNFVVMPFSIASIRFIGEVFDRTGRYDLAFQVFIGTAFLATALIWRVRLPRQGAGSSRQPGGRDASGAAPDRDEGPALHAEAVPGLSKE
ncbi:MFS transporter [Sinimarinibacterium flocculans]|uniref:Sugar phosphate permease n=1 Tax=Sinimarinibacterium flocculans TaxID=985250 RepID=A0A318EG47_9GAMM|nr:MFS transporter [Sinimarinibacterium flocculans]PXV70654.1 sugar phosphate permease [Sinimarinibacterium flocculans]